MHSATGRRLARLADGVKLPATVAQHVETFTGLHGFPLDASPALVNAFVPLVAVDARNGTEIQPGSHLDTHGMPTDALAPLPHGVVPSLDAGDLLLFHYRAVHRGLANASASARPVLYFTYGADGAVDTHNFPTDEPLLNERGSA